MAITWEPDLSQARTFRRMLIDYKNFGFTPFPDKNDFLKSPETLFLAIFDHFRSFLYDGDFSKNIRLKHAHPHVGSYYHAKFQKKLNSQFQENCQKER